MNPSHIINDKYDEENHDLVVDDQAEISSNINQNLLMKCINNNSYCISLMDYIKKGYHFSQIDFYSAYVQLLYCFKPQELNELSRIRKHLKNQWARDDPGFVIVIMFNIIITSLAYTLCLSSFDRFIPIFFKQFFINFLFFGIIMTFSGKNIIEKYFKNEELSLGKNQRIELFYSFDIHCNSFVPFYFCSVTVQFLLLPILNTDSFISVILSNVLYTAAYCGYLLVSNIGYLGKC